MTQSGREDDIYLDSLYVALAGIPGTLLGILTVNIVGAKAMLGWWVLGCWKFATSSFSLPVSVFSLVVSGVSSLLIWVIPDQNKTEDVVVILSSVFGGVSIIGWNAVDVISTSELFPVHLRSAAWNNCHGMGAGTSFHGDELFLLHESVVTRLWSRIFHTVTQHGANMNVYKSFKSLMLLTLHGVVSISSHSTSHTLSC